MYMFMGCKGGVCVLGTAVMQWQFQCVHWLATGDTVAGRRGKENKWACHWRDVSCLLNTNAYSKYVVPGEAFVFGIVRSCYPHAVSAHVQRRFLCATL